MKDIIKLRLYSMVIPMVVAVTFAGTLAPDEDYLSDNPPDMRPHAGLAAYYAATAIMQDATGYLEVEQSPGHQYWPNSGAMPILTFGWGGDRPLPVRMALDSTRSPLTTPGRPPVLIVQRRNDVFSPLFDDILQQNEPIPRLVFTIDRIHGSALVYTLFNARVIGVRNVGKVIEENPSTEEIVFVFERMVEGR